MSNYTGTPRGMQMPWHNPNPNAAGFAGRVFPFNYC